MLKKLTVKGFKSLVDVTVELPRLAVIFGPNAAGKSNLLEAIQVLAWIPFSHSLRDVLGDKIPIRGRAFEAFSFDEGGLPALLRQPSADFTVEVDVSAADKLYRYRIQPSMSFESFDLSVKDEYLARLQPSRRKPIVEMNDGRLIVRQEGTGQVHVEPGKRNQPILSDRSFSRNGFSDLDDVRAELGSWRTYYFEPRLLMREDESPMDVGDIAIHGEMLARYLYRLKATEPKRLQDMLRTLRSFVPSVEALDVTLDDRRGILELGLQQGGVYYSARVLSEGTLRLLALCAAAINPWRTSLIALEEPENGVHPRRIDRIARLLVSLSEQGTQIIVTSHSPLFVDAILAIQRRELVEGIRLFNVRFSEGQTRIEPFDPSPLFADSEVVDALSSPGEDTVFQGLVRRGYLDG